MDALWIMLRNTIVFVALALPGFILVKTKMLKQEQSGALSKLLMYVGMPFMILTSTINNVKFDGELLAVIGIVAAIGVTYTVATFFLSKPLTLMDKAEKTRGMMRFSAVFSNNGFLGIPLAMAVFGAGSRILMVVIIINIITNLLMYTLGIYLISGDKSTISWKKALLNPVLIAFVLGIALNLLNAKYGFLSADKVPEVLTFSTHFSNIVTPISMTILGMKMGQVDLGKIFVMPKMYYSAFIKLIVVPALIIAIMFAVKGAFGLSIIDDNMFLGVFIAFSMPTAGLASALADGCNGDIENSVTYTLGSTILSVLTIPLLYMLLTMMLA